MKAKLVLLALGAILIAGCSYNTRTGRFQYCEWTYEVKPPKYPIPDVSPVPQSDKR